MKRLSATDQTMEQRLAEQYMLGRAPAQSMTGGMLPSPDTLMAMQQMRGQANSTPAAIMQKNAAIPQQMGSRPVPEPLTSPTASAPEPVRPQPQPMNETRVKEAMQVLLKYKAG